MGRLWPNVANKPGARHDSVVTKNRGVTKLLRSSESESGTGLRLLAIPTFFILNAGKEFLAL